MSSFVKVVGAIALLVLAAVGLLMSLCGGFFTFTGLFAQSMSGVLAIAVPSLLGGLAVLWFSITKFLARIEGPPET